MKRLKSGLNGLFVLLFVFSLLLLWLVPFRGQKDISQTENRALSKLPAFTMKDFVQGDFQNNLENAVSDQLIFSEETRSFIKDIQATALEREQALLYRLDPKLKNGYSQITDGFYTYLGDEHRIVERPHEWKEMENQLAAFADPFNKLDQAEVYLYFINNSRSIDFDRPDGNKNIYKWVKSFFSLKGSTCFEIGGYEDYCKWFYQTDHHWNDLGFYRGYTEIMTMLKPGDSLIVSGERFDTGTVFNGSYARVTKSLRADEHFVVRSFSLPKYSLTINGKRGTYGRLNAYLNGRYANEPLTNHYANCYGGDYGEIVYDYGTEGRGRLLLVSSSYSNPINALIASHYDQTWVIDLRYYEDYAGHSFDCESYVKDHSIDTVLLLGDIQFFLADSTKEGDEG